MADPILEVVNWMHPNTISRLSLKQQFDTDTGAALYTPFMGVFVQTFPGATLPDPAAVTAQVPAYHAMIAQLQADIQAKAALPDLATQVAHLTAAVVSLGGTLPDEQVAAANDKLTSIGQPAISIAEKIGVVK